MNENVGFLNFYVQPSKYPLPLFLSEDIVDYVPALIFIYDSRSQRIAYGNGKFRDFTGRDVQNLDITLEVLVHSQDQPKVGQVLKACLSDGTGDLRPLHRQAGGSQRALCFSRRHGIPAPGRRHLEQSSITDCTRHHR